MRARRAAPPAAKRLPPKPAKTSEWCVGGGKDLHIATEVVDRAIKRAADRADAHWRDVEKQTTETYQKRHRIRCPWCGRLLHPKIHVESLFHPSFESLRLPTHKTKPKSSRA